MTLAEKQLSILRRWAQSCRADIHAVPSRPDLMYYGDGTNGWGTQTNQKAFAALAVLATAKGGEPELADTALALLRYSLESHITGSFHTTDSETFHWGHTWISILGVERMMYGVEAVWDLLTAEDRKKLRAMLLSEADWQLEQQVVAGIENISGRNKPESNMWNGSLLLRAAAMYPDAPNREAYLRQGRKYVINAVSVPSDAVSEEVIDGKPLREWHAGANFAENMALDHHGYLNLGYMVITLSQTAMYHFSMRAAGLEADPAVYHHARRLWQMIRSLLFDDGRLWRIGGDTRVRYCYCQDFLLPVLCLAQDLFGENTEEMENSWADLVKKEMDYNGDGSFLSRRCELFRERSPLYFTRLESDRANVIGFSYYYRARFENFREPARAAEPVRLLTQWQDGFHGACMVRSADRFASFCWKASDHVCGTFLHPADSSAAEWTYNLVSEVIGDGSYDTLKVLEHHETMLQGGFLTSGAYTWHTNGMLAEQISEEDTLTSRLAFAVLPDGVTGITLQRATAAKTCHLRQVKPLDLKIPNDVFNDFTRDYAMSEDETFCAVDGRLSVTVLGGGKLRIHRPDCRQIGLTIHIHEGKFVPYKERGFLHCDELLVSPVMEPRFYELGSEAYDFAAVLRTDGRRAEAAYERSGNKRVVTVRGADGVTYRLTANLGPACEEGLAPCETRLESV